MSVEAELVSKLLHTGDYATLEDRQISWHYFNGRHKQGINFIRKYVLSYGKVPSMKTFQKKFPSYSIYSQDELEEPLVYYCDEVRNKRKHNDMVTTVEEVTNLLGERESDSAYDKLKVLVNHIENDVIESDRKHGNKDTKSRMDSYHERATSGGMTGIPSFIDLLDKLLKGYHAEELITILAYTGVGKTWFHILQAVAMAKEGYRVLFFTTEMSTELVQRRIDALGAELSYTRFRDGQLMPDEMKRFEEYLDWAEGNDDFNITIEQVTGGVSQIGAKIDQHQPDIVLVDGGYLLADDESEGEDDWKALIRVWRGLHKLAQTKKIPVLVNTQSKERKVGLETIQFAKMIAQDSDIVLALEQDDQMWADKEIKIKPLKIREGEIKGNIFMEWDFDGMNYGTIYSEGNSRGEEIPSERGAKDMKSKPSEQEGVQELA